MERKKCRYYYVTYSYNLNSNHANISSKKIEAESDGSIMEKLIDELKHLISCDISLNVNKDDIHIINFWKL